MVSAYSLLLRTLFLRCINVLTRRSIVLYVTFFLKRLEMMDLFLYFAPDKNHY